VQNSSKIRENPPNPRLKPSKTYQNFHFFAKNLRLFNIQNRFLCPKTPFSPKIALKKIGQTRKFLISDI